MDEQTAELAKGISALDLRLKKTEIAIQVLRAAVAVLMQEAGWRFSLDVLEKVEQDAAASSKGLQETQAIFDRLTSQREQAQ